MQVMSFAKVLMCGQQQRQFSLIQTIIQILGSLTRPDLRYVQHASQSKNILRIWSRDLFKSQIITLMRLRLRCTSFPCLRNNLSQCNRCSSKVLHTLRKPMVYCLLALCLRSAAVCNHRQPKIVFVNLFIYYCVLS